MAGRRALFAYLRSFGGSPPPWDKTHHHAHPVQLQASQRRASQLRERERTA